LPSIVDFDRFSSDVENLTGKEEVGYRGEAAVFAHLRNSRRFAKVVWANQSVNGHRVEFGGELFFLSELQGHSDIEFTTDDDKMIDVVVMSSARGKSDGRACHYCGGRQLDLFTGATKQRGSMIPLVFDTTL
jgi:hypothetical protein